MLEKQNRIEPEDPIIKYSHYNTYRQLKSGQGQRGKLPRNCRASPRPAAASPVQDGISLDYASQPVSPLYAYDPNP